MNATTAIVERLKQQVKEKHIKEPSECKQLLIESIKEQMQVVRLPIILRRNSP